MGKAAQYVTKMLRLFGVIDTEDIGMGGGAAGNTEEVVAPIMNAFADFREAVRDSAKAHNIKELLIGCDDVRDKHLPNAGVRLEDRPGQKAVWRLESREA